MLLEMIPVFIISSQPDVQTDVCRKILEMTQIGWKLFSLSMLGSGLFWANKTLVQGSPEPH